MKTNDLQPGTKIRTLSGRTGTISASPAASDMSTLYYFVRLDTEDRNLDRWVRKSAVTAIGNGGAS